MQTEQDIRTGAHNMAFESWTTEREGVGRQGQLASRATDSSGVQAVATDRMRLGAFLGPHDPGVIVLWRPFVCAEDVPN